MARDDWRIRIELEPEHAGGFLGRLGGGLSSRAHDLARELEAEKLAVSRDDDTLFVYAATRTQARQAQQLVETEFEEAKIEPIKVKLEHWLAAEERWDDEPKGETWEEEALDEGYSPWEVRVECDSHDAAEELADQLEKEGLSLARRWKYVVVGADTEDEAKTLASRLHGEVEAGGGLVYEAMPHNPFAIFGGLGG
jgi:hypothetical protein